MRVMAVGAHPDDVEMYCSGTLLACRARGDDLFVCCMTNGDKGAYEMTCEELAAIRRREAGNAAAIIGAELMFLNLPDGELFVDEACRAPLIDAVRQARPDIIITHNPEDYHPDHCNTSALVFSASFLAGAPNVKGQRDLPGHDRVPSVFYMDTPTGTGFQPTEYVDITPHWETKVRVIECHASQVQWIREHDGLDIVNVARVMAEFRGMQSGVRYAEGFRQLTQWPRMTTRRLLP